MRIVGVSRCAMAFFGVLTAVPALAVDAPIYRHAGSNDAAIGVFCLDLAGNYTGCGGSTTNNVMTSLATWWTELSAQSVATSGFTGPSRSSGAAAGQSAPYAYFSASASSSQPGTLTLTNETTPALSVSFSLSSPGVVTGRMPAFGTSFHASFVPSSAATVSLADGYTAN